MSAEAILLQLGESFAGVCPAAPAGWGASPWGSTPWGGASTGSVNLCLVFAFAHKENVVRLYFSEPIKFTRTNEPGDGSLLKNYQVVANGGVGIDGLGVRPIKVAAVELVAGSSNTQVDVTVDRPFSPYGTTYRATVNNIVSLTGKLLGPGQNTVVFVALQRGLPSAVPDLSVSTRDIANPQTRAALFDPLPEASTSHDAVLGTFRVDSLGDIAFDEGLTSYKKRVYRRLTFGKNRTGHLPGYGVGTPDHVKRLARPAVREALAADAEEQIRQEPETVAVRVTVEVTSSGVGFYRIRAKTSVGRSVNFAAPVAFNPTEESNA